VRSQLEKRGITAAGFDAYVERTRTENAARVRVGDLDHLIFYALQSTHFTSLPPIEPALSAKALMESGGRVPPDISERLAALSKTLETSSRDPRIVYFRALVQSAFPNRGTRDAALLDEYRRVMRFIYEKEFVAQKTGPEAVAELYRARGLSTDTAIEAGYVVYNGLGAIKALEPERRIRRVLIVGPGLDLAPRTSFVEAAPPESYQPWAVIDALVSLGLSRLDDLTVVGADINPRVVDRLRQSRDAPPALMLVSGIGETATRKFSQDYREYFAQLGRAIGDVKDAAPPRGLEGHLAKTVTVRRDAARVLQAEPLDVVTERLDGAAPFDLVLATNILPYFDDIQLTLAMSNIGAMLAPGGMFLHNEPRPMLGDVTALLGFPFERSRQVVIATGTGTAAPLVDTLFTHRKLAAVPNNLGFSFTNIAPQAGLTARTVYGQQGTNTYLVETTGTGIAAFDYDGDGWVDIFVVNGSTLEGFPNGREPTNHLYRNRGNGTFEDVTSAARLGEHGWGQAACVGDFDTDGHDDLFVSYWGPNHLYRNRGDGTFDDVTGGAGLAQSNRRWNTGCAFIDYDRDGLLDLFVANYIDFDLAATPTPAAGLCRYKGLAVACGPPGLPGAKNLLYHNLGHGKFEDVSNTSGITRAGGTYALGVATLDFDGDGWTDIFVADDSNPSTLYRNNHDGTFTDVAIRAGCAYSQDGRAQSGMGLAIGDYDRNGTMDIFKTNFAGDTSTLYVNTGNGACDDRTFAAGFGVNTRWLGWGVGFVDLDGDGWLDLFLANGHVYPEVDRLKSEAGYKQPKVVYRNLGNGRFTDISEQLGPPITSPKAARGAAFADFDNDGDVDVAISNVNDTPDLFRLDRMASAHWVSVKLVGRRSNRDAIGALVRVITADGEQRQEVRGGGSYYSQNDFRLHFGLGKTAAIQKIVVRWPNGLEESFAAPDVDRLYSFTEASQPR
jgi:enediyne biosynthesis protein E4